MGMLLFVWGSAIYAASFSVVHDKSFTLFVIGLAAVGIGGAMCLVDE